MQVFMNRGIQAVALVALAFALTAVGSAQSRKGRNQTPVVQPYARAWKYETDAMTIQQVSADAGIVIVPLLDGKVVALQPDEGNLLWSVDLGGDVSTAPLINANVIYVATSRNGTDQEGVLRALDRSTGLTVWVREFSRPIVSGMLLADGKLLAGSADGALYALNPESGATVWSFATRGAVRGHIAVWGAMLLVGSDDGALYAVDHESGKELWRYQTGGPIVGRAATSGKRLFVASGDGWVYCIETGSQRLLWKSRTGAAIEASPVVVDEDHILVASYDNFVYKLDIRTGARAWKKRLNGRLVSDPILNGARMIVAPLRDDRLTVMNVKDGNKVAAVALEPGDELVAPPTLVGTLLLLPTDTGLIAARSILDR